MGGTNIKKITSVENLGSFSGFKWNASIPEFKRYNLLYGWNGAGKTTLSRLFRYISENDYRTEYNTNNEDKPAIEVELKGGSKINIKDSNLDDKVKVFNTDYIKDNLKWDKGATSSVILFVGKIAKEKKEELEQLEKKLTTQKNRKEGLETSLRSKETELEKWLNETVLPIRKDSGLTGNAYNINKFKSDLEQAIGNEDSFTLLTDEDLTKFKNSVKEINDKGTLAENIPDLKEIDPLTLRKSTNDILAFSLVPNSDDDLKVIESDDKIFSWVETGFDIHKNLDKCLFCGEDIATDRRQKLKDFLQSKQAELIASIDILITNINNYTKKIQTTRCSDNDLFQEFRSEYQQKHEIQETSANKLKSGLKSLSELIEWKKSHLFDDSQGKEQELQNLDIDALIKNLQTASNEKKSIIDNHNARVTDFDKSQKQARDKIIKHHIKSILQKYKDSLNAVGTAKTNYDKATQEFVDLSQKIEILKSELSNAKKGADAINTHLASMGHGHIKLEESPQEIGYILTRMEKRAQNLSEGEKTAVAVAFFINSLKDSSFKLKDNIVVIDDPVSSLDSNVLSFVFSMIKEYTTEAAQLFILTHNHQFFVKVLKWKRNNATEFGCYEIKREINITEGRILSTLLPMDGYLIKRYNEYHHLFFLLYNCSKVANNNLPSEDVRFTHLNIARRVLECFFGFWYPGNNNLEDAINHVKNSLEEMAIENHEALCQSAYVVTNTLSHGDIDSILGIGDAVNSETPETTIKNCLKIIEALVPEHYRQMCIMCENDGDYSLGIGNDSASAVA